MEKFIQRHNAERLLRIQLICNEALSFIEDKERKVIEIQEADLQTLEYLTDLKEEIKEIGMRYEKYLDECTSDFIQVSPEVIERVKLQTNAVKRQLFNHSKFKPQGIEIYNKKLTDLDSSDYQW